MYYYIIRQDDHKFQAEKVYHNWSHSLLNPKNYDGITSKITSKNEKNQK